MFFILDALEFGSSTPAYIVGASIPSAIIGSFTPGAITSDLNLGPTIGAPYTIIPSTTPNSNLSRFDHPVSNDDLTPSIGIFFKITRELPISLQMDEECVKLKVLKIHSNY